jgi:hypothetical protein
MKFLSYLLLLLLLCPQSPATTTNVEDDPYGEQAVRNALSSNGVTFSFTEKAINRLGDRAAVGLMRIIADKTVTSPDQVKSILSILRTAFSAPSIIAVEADRQPKATLFLLQSLESIQLSSRDVIAEIGETKAFILQNTKPN